VRITVSAASARPPATIPTSAHPLCRPRNDPLGAAALNAGAATHATTADHSAITRIPIAVPTVASNAM